MTHCKETKALLNSKLVVDETTWKCAFCPTTFPDHNALIEHIVQHLEGFLKQYPYSVQEEIVRKFIEEIS